MEGWQSGSKEFLAGFEARNFIKNIQSKRGISEDEAVSS